MELALKVEVMIHKDSFCAEVPKNRGKPRAFRLTLLLAVAGVVLNDFRLLRFRYTFPHPEFNCRLLMSD